MDAGFTTSSMKRAPVLRRSKKREGNSKRGFPPFASPGSRSSQRSAAASLPSGRSPSGVAEKLEIPSGLEGAVVATLKRLGLGDCVEVKERIDKAALRKLSDVDLTRCGVRRVSEDHFRIEPNLEFVSEITGRDTPFPAVTVDMDRLSGAVKIRDGET